MNYFFSLPHPWFLVNRNTDEVELMYEIFSLYWDIGFRQREVERMAIAFPAAMNVAIVMLRQCLS